jgi:hypothetical protein
MNELLARVGSGFFQQAFVVDDLVAAQDACRRTLGCGEFVVLAPTSLPYTLRGCDVECALEIGFARSGDIQIELIRPVSGEGLHVEFLASHGPGAHHLGFMVESLDAELAASAYAPLMSGQFGSLRFAYVDTWDALGTYTELVEDPDGLMMSMCPWR